jgi:hypothetical protein
MKKDASQQLNNPDIKAVQEVIKPTIETHIKLIPKWGQVSVDAITGQSISQKIVSGVKSETKATGVATVLLKNELLFKEIPQTGTKGSKYEWSKDLVEYHKTMDPLFKKKFEQKVLDSWGMGETQFNKAKLSGIYKAIMTQTGKAVYMQSVKQALPNTPELTMKHVLANMINQVSAGKSPSLASQGELMNEVQRSLNKFAEKEINFNPSVNSFHTLFTEKQYAKYVKNGDASKFLDKWAKLHELTQNFEKSIEVQAEVMAEGMVGKTTKEVKAVEAKNAKEAATILKEFKRFKDIDVSEGLYDWSMNATKVAAQNKFELALANKYPKSVLDNIKTNFMSTFGQHHVWRR